MVSEAVANCALHAYPGTPGRVRVRAELTRDALDVVVSDDGVGPAPRVDSPGLGIGVPLMDDFADSVTVDANEGTRVTARFELFGPAGPHGRQVPRQSLGGRARRRLSRLLGLGR